MSDQLEEGNDEEQVLAMGNEILRILGAEDQITDVETFTYDSLYLQLFEAFFPNQNLNQIQAGDTAEEMASNIQTLIDLLGESVLEIDLSFISSMGIVQGELIHIAKFLEVILEVIVMLARDEEEEEEEESKASPPQPVPDEDEAPQPEIISDEVYGKDGPGDKQIIDDQDDEIEDKPVEEVMKQDFNEPLLPEDDEEPLKADSLDMG